jgi:hypothetical protein
MGSTLFLIATHNLGPDRTAAHQVINPRAGRAKVADAMGPEIYTSKYSVHPDQGLHLELKGPHLFVLANEMT